MIPTRAAPITTSAAADSSESSRPRAFAFSRHDRWTSVHSKSMEIVLPDPGDQAVTDLLLIPDVTRQVLREELLLVEEPPDEKRQHGGDRGKAPVRAERQR